MNAGGFPPISHSTLLNFQKSGCNIITMISWRMIARNIPYFSSSSFYSVRTGRINFKKTVNHRGHRLKREDQVSPFKSPLAKGDSGGCVFSWVILQPPLPPFLRGFLHRICHVIRINKMKIPIQSSYKLEPLCYTYSHRSVSILG